jgi:hypothetical protein
MDSTDFLVKTVKNVTISTLAALNARLKIPLTVFSVTNIISSSMETVTKIVLLHTSELTQKLVNLVVMTVLFVPVLPHVLNVKKDSSKKKKDVLKTAEMAGLMIRIKSVKNVLETVSNVFLIKLMFAQSVMPVNI